MDNADFVTNLEERMLKKLSCSNTLRTKIPFSGFCLSCEEPISERRFCDSDCRKDFEDRTKR